MAPGKQRKEERRGKTKLLLLPMSETTNLEKVKPNRENNTTEMIEAENTPLEERNKEHCEKKPLRLRGKIYIVTTPGKTR